MCLWVTHTIKLELEVELVQPHWQFAILLKYYLCSLYSVGNNIIKLVWPGDT